MAQFDRFFGLGKYLFEDEARVLVRERVVLKAAVGLSVGEHSRLDEDAGSHRHLAARDQVVEHGGNKLHIPAAVLENHDTGGILGPVLGGDVDSPLARGPGKDLALPLRHL